MLLYGIGLDFNFMPFAILGKYNPSPWPDDCHPIVILHVDRKAFVLMPPYLGRRSNRSQCTRQSDAKRSIEIERQFTH
ncbi:hypothetical protein EB232_18200 [Mesorhizobium sp. NZP2077]|nr:hypothetical protein EB232_18200 [Mesorhizobium sp. NZP2077]